MSTILVCETCGGTGIIGSEEEGVPCTSCGGDGRVPFLNEIPTYEILEATDPTEYISLAPGNVALYNLIISAGTVDLTSDTVVWAVLMGMFGEGTTTRTNLIALIS